MSFASFACDSASNWYFEIDLLDILETEDLIEDSRYNYHWERSKLFMLREPLLMLQCNNQLIIVHYLNYIICNVKALPEKGRFGCFLKDWEVMRGALSQCKR